MTRVTGLAITVVVVLSGSGDQVGSADHVPRSADLRQAAILSETVRIPIRLSTCKSQNLVDECTESSNTASIFVFMKHIQDKAQRFHPSLPIPTLLPYNQLSRYWVKYNHES